MSQIELAGSPHVQSDQSVPTLLSGPAHPALPVDETTLHHDRSIRSHLRWRLEQATSGQTSARVVEELNISSGIGRVDMAVLNGVLHGFEIKSERDTLTRLHSQAAIFSEVMDFVTLVTVEQFQIESMSIVPEWWGVAIARRQRGVVYFETVRAPQQNPNVNVDRFLEFLWKDEAYRILENRGETRGLKSASKAKLWRRLADVIPWPDLHAAVLSTLKTREPSGPISRRK